MLVCICTHCSWGALCVCVSLYVYVYVFVHLLISFRFISQTTTILVTGIGRKFAPLFPLHLLVLLKLFSPPSPQFQCCLFLRAMRAGIFRTEVRTSKHAHCTTLKLGARGETVKSFCFFHFDTCLSFVSLSGMVRTLSATCTAIGSDLPWKLIVVIHVYTGSMINNMCRTCDMTFPWTIRTFR